MSELIDIISKKDKLLDFMERYNLSGLREATEEQLKEYIEEILQSANLAIEALREQAERSKGCEYCNPNPYGHGEAIKQLITQIFNDNAYIHTFVSGKGLHTIAYPSPQDTNLAKTYSKCKIINFCPMCGKKLEE